MYNKSFRKPMAMLLTLTMVGGLGGITALADETGQASVTAEVCVSDANPELELSIRRDVNNVSGTNAGITTIFLKTRQNYAGC